MGKFFWCLESDGLNTDSPFMIGEIDPDFNKLILCN